MLNTFIDIGCLEYHSSQRLQFGEGALRRQWFSQFPQLFDQEDFVRARNRTRPYFFYEWLAAIVLHQSTGFLALVTRYQTDIRKRAILPKIVSPEVLSALEDRTRWGKTQGPDLLMYAMDYSDWFFCECKGPGDILSERQLGNFKDLVMAAKKPIRKLRFQEYK